MCERLTSGGEREASGSAAPVGEGADRVEVRAHQLQLGDREPCEQGGPSSTIGRYAAHVRSCPSAVICTSTCVHSLVRRTIDPPAPAGRYVGLTNFGGITRATPVARQLAPESWHFVFGRRAFFGAHPTPDGDVVWFANVPRPEIGRDERRTTTDEQRRRARVERIVAAGARSSSSKIPGPVGRRVQEAVLKLVFRRLVTERSTGWMSGHRIDWETPVS